MNKNSIITFMFIITCIIGNSQSKKNMDIQSIKSMCGCFKVDFYFSETFVFSDAEDYQKSNDYKSGALEWAQVVSDDDNKISIQHLLIVGPKKFPSIVKHWRQDWLYQNRDFYFYDKNDRWSYVNLSKRDVRGQWTQKVFQVDDSPRYEGSSTWVHVDGNSFWENVTPAPLPRREFSKRKDYNVTLRGNKHLVTKSGWIHDQDNKKINKSDDGNERVLAHEKGYNIYTKVSDTECQPAIDWWNKNSKKWDLVRNKWNQVYSLNKDLSMKPAVDNKKLYSFLFSPDITDKNDIDSTIDMFLMN